MKRAALLSLSAAAGLGAGFAFRALRHHGGGPLSTSAAVASSSAAKSSHTTGAGSTAPAEELQATLAVSDDITRWLHLITAVERASAQDFPALAALAAGMPGALEILAARWIEKDPRGMCAACLKGHPDGAAFPARQLGNMLFSEWPARDPGAVLAVLRDHPDMLSGWQMQALEGLFPVDPEGALLALIEGGIDVSSLSAAGLEKWAAADPRHATAFLLAHPAGEFTRRAMEIAGKQWAQTDPAAALAFASAENTASRRILGNEVIKSWVERDMPAAAAWFAAADDSACAPLLSPFVEAWAKKDAEAALQWCLAHTESDNQDRLVTALISGASARSPDAAAALVAGLPPSPARTRAALAFAEAMRNRDWWPNMVTRPPGGKARPEALTWLAQLDGDTRRGVVSALSHSWSENDPRGFAEYLLSPEGEGASPGSLRAAARQLARVQPLEAMALASQAPGQRAETLTDTFGSWMRSQPADAMEWLKKLPASDDRREACYLGAVYDALPAGYTGRASAEDRERVRTLAGELASDPAAARATLAALTISGEDRSRLAQRLGLEQQTAPPVHSGTN